MFAAWMCHMLEQPSVYMCVFLLVVVSAIQLVFS